MTQKFPEATKPDEFSYTEPKEKLRGPHDFIIERVTLVAFDGSEVDISYIRDAITIHQDLFRNTICGEITVNDANDLPQLLPIIGEEHLIITFTRPDVKGDPRATNRGEVHVDEEILEPFDMTFRVYRMDGRKWDKEYHQRYTLYFVSQERISDLKTRLAQSFIGMSYSDMAEKIFERIKVEKEIFVEPTEYLHNYYTNSKRPIEILNHISARSVSAEGNGANYVFYEDSERFNFVSIGHLLRQEPVEYYTYNIANVFRHQGSVLKPDNIVNDLRAAEEFAHSTDFDLLINLDSGMYGSKLLTYDLLRGTFETKEFFHGKEFEKYPHLSKFRYQSSEFVDESPDSVHRVRETNLYHDTFPHIVEKDPFILPNRVEDTVLLRRAQLREINNRKITVLVSGDPRRKAGDIIEFRLPSATGDATESRPREDDKYLSGNYLVLSVSHLLLWGKYLMRLEIVKDSYLLDPEFVDPNDYYAGIW